MPRPPQALLLRQTVHGGDSSANHTSRLGHLPRTPVNLFPLFPRASGPVSSGTLSFSLPVLEEFGGASELRHDIDSIPKVCQCTPRGDVMQNEGCGNKKWYEVSTLPFLVDDYLLRG